MNKPHVKPPPGLAFDDEGQLIGMTEFDWQVIFAAQEQVGAGSIEEFFNRIRNEEKSLARAEVVVKLLLAILHDDPSEKEAGRRLYIAAHRCGLLSTSTDAELAREIGTTPDAIKKSVKALYFKSYENATIEDKPDNLAPPGHS